MNQNCMIFTQLQLILLVLTGASIMSETLASAEESSIPPGVQVRNDIVYGKGGGEDLLLDIAMPVNAEQPLPCIVVLHGGGWFAGDKSSEREYALFLARNGAGAAMVNYRLAPDFRYPAAVEDVKCAVRFLRAHAKEYNIDPERIGATGISAGAHLAMMLGVTGGMPEFEGAGGWPEESSRVSAVVALYGPADLARKGTPPNTARMVRDFIGGTPEEKPDAYKAASPLTHVDKDDAPLLILHGSTDNVVPLDQALAMVRAMTKAGAKGRVSILIGGGHGWGGENLEQARTEALDFFRRYLALDNNETP